MFARAGAPGTVRQERHTRARTGAIGYIRPAFRRGREQVAIGRQFGTWVGRALGALVLAWLALPARAAPEESIRLASGTEIASQRYPAGGKALAVWITGQYGRVEEEHKAAADMAAQGVETWVTDFYAPYFLPLVPSGWSQVPDQDVAEWLEQVRQRQPGRVLVLVAPGRAASLALRAVSAWQARFGQAGARPAPVAGALLMFPLLYQELDPGQEPEYDPAVKGARLDLVILQPKSSAGFWWRDRLKGILEQAGSRVWLTVLPGLRDGFYRRGDINAQEIAAGARLGQIVLEGMAPLIAQRPVPPSAPEVRP